MEGQGNQGGLIFIGGEEHIKEVYSQICHYEYPEQLFGELGESKDEQLRKLASAFKHLVKLYHPDHYVRNPENHQLADNLIKILNYLRAEAEKRIVAGKYGQVIEASPREPECIISTAVRDYRVIKFLEDGEQSNLYHAEYDDPDDRFLPIKEAVIKIIKDPANNDLIENELRALRTLSHQSLPKLIDYFVVPDDGKKAIIMNVIDGYDLYHVRKKYPGGIPDRHMCWIFERLLSVLGFMHYNAVLHGNLEPGNIMIRSRDHNSFLVDFLHSRVSPGKRDYLEVVAREFAAPESFRKAPPHPAADLYSLAKSMLYILGGDIVRDTLPPRVDPRIARFLQQFLAGDPGQRANDAWKMYNLLSDLRLEVYGARHEFLPFEM